MYARNPHGIYTDDADAAEKLVAKIERLEAQRENAKQRNAAFRKEHKAELKAEPSAYQRDRMMPFPSYVGKNLTGQISQAKARLANLPAAKAQLEAGREIVARYGGRCEDCGDVIEKGDRINYSATGCRCVECAPSLAVAA